MNFITESNSLECRDRQKNCATLVWKRKNKISVKKRYQNAVKVCQIINSDMRMTDVRNQITESVKNDLYCLANSKVKVDLCKANFTHESDRINIVCPMTIVVVKFADNKNIICDIRVIDFANSNSKNDDDTHNNSHSKKDGDIDSSFENLFEKRAMIIVEE
jgi:hypothetical protein